jgi:hypothetical protein
MADARNHEPEKKKSVHRAPNPADPYVQQAILGTAWPSEVSRTLHVLLSVQTTST